jgi:hypothetical protein
MSRPPKLRRAVSANAAPWGERSEAASIASGVGSIESNCLQFAFGGASVAKRPPYCSMASRAPFGGCERSECPPNY